MSTPSSASTVLFVLRPELPFRAIGRAFATAGWRGGPTTLTAPLVPGEPELAAWRKDGALARYECNPVVWLRLLRVTGPVPPPALPVLGTPDVLALLASGNEVERLLGVLAAAELRLGSAHPG